MRAKFNPSRQNAWWTSFRNLAKLFELNAVSGNLLEPCSTATRNKPLLTLKVKLYENKSEP
jgi:hypothetical protein